MRKKHNFKNLKVWEKSVDLAVKVYELTAEFPSEEKYGITSQMRRSSVSIPSNIAEGSAKNSSKSFLNSLDISLGESFELETQAIIARRVGIMNDSAFQLLENEISEVQRMINGFIQTIDSNPY
ncbi:four helix bundle protein [Belliella kenyensis]|uniref:Four helix bundle protein n=1 Tax=Belliella kenyensis TaxID=1472724 RepID=A0ABV8EMW2_9BACT|nr:four helix bundle protein [Belliella kenyensis]MCH7401688.1 four helix bundle protein [Belliella kenyensis]MDN3603034.1 four helix bundle protein [Belliella kenyensis]